MSDEMSAFDRGREVYRSGIRRIPSHRPPDHEFNGPCSESAFEWLGYMVERGLTLINQDRERHRIRNYIERGTDL
jgi:hypothetical protein